MSIDTFNLIVIHAFYCAMIAFGLFRTMQTENDLLGFVPQWIERKIGVHSLAYRLISCPVCLSGQVAFWAGLFVFRSSQYPITFIVSGTFVALFWGWALEKYFNR